MVFLVTGTALDQDAVSGVRAGYSVKSVRTLLAFAHVNCSFVGSHSFSDMRFSCFVADELPAEVEELDCCPVLMSDCALP